jgi:hypothetical protein
MTFITHIKIKIMKFLSYLEEILTSYLNQFGLAWWVEIVTDQPHCTYYFGPFMSAKKAQEAQRGYIEDLEEEEVQGIRVTIKQLQPQELTIY